MNDAISFHSAVHKVIENDRSLIITIDITVNVKFPISDVSNETMFFSVEGDASRNTTALETKSSTRMSYFATPAIFSNQGPKQYKPITAAQYPPTSW